MEGDFNLDEAESAMMPEQYGTGLHWPHCINQKCTGCLPDDILENLSRIIKSGGTLNLSVFRTDTK